MGLSYVDDPTIRVDGLGRGTLLCGVGTGTNGSQSFVSKWVKGNPHDREDPFTRKTHTLSK